MAETLYDARGNVSGYRGSRAGESFASPAEAAAKKREEDEWAEYARSIGQSPNSFSGLGGGAMRSKHKGAFSAWRSTRTGKGNLGSLIGGGQ